MPTFLRSLARSACTSRRWPFFTTTLNNAEISLGTADLITARRYAELAANPVLLAEIEQEYAACANARTRITGQRALLERTPLLACSIGLRNPYVDALHLAQLTLLRRYRSVREGIPGEERTALLDAIHHTINGIAAGLQMNR